MGDPGPAQRSTGIAGASPRPRVYLVRHGETDWNAAGRLLSRTDEPLNAEGERQAEELAEALVGIAWDHACASPLLRARRTAEVILGTRPDAPPLIVDGRLREMDFGPFEGWTEAQLETDAVAAGRRRDGAQLDGAESEAAVEARARSFFEDVNRLRGTTLVVGHGRMLRILLASAVLGVPAERASAMRMRNCRPAIIEPGPKPLLLGLNVGPPAAEAFAPKHRAAQAEDRPGPAGRRQP